MATTIPVIGLSPVSFASEDAATLGQQYQIPLTLLTFKADGTIDASAWTKKAKLGDKDTKLVPLLLADLVKRGVLTKPSA